MATIKLGQRPKTFKPIVITFPMPEGGDGAIEITYHYRTRSEFGALMDELYREATQTERKEGEDFSMRELMEKTRDKNADYLMKCVASWNLDVELTTDSMRQLADELPGAAHAIMEKYRIAAIEGRLGN